MRKTPLMLAGLVAAPAAAGTITVSIPHLTVAEYHRPYVAGWLEPVGGGDSKTLFVWYDVKKMGNEPGTKWLSDLRTWWRKGGRSLNLPADGLSGATRAPRRPARRDPRRREAWPVYALCRGRARDRRTRTRVRAFVRPAKAATASGKSELGAVTVSLR